MLPTDEEDANGGRPGVLGLEAILFFLFRRSREFFCIAACLAFRSTSFSRKACSSALSAWIFWYRSASFLFLMSAGISSGDGASFSAMGCY